VELTAASAMLLEAETGTVIFEKNADEQRPVASVTKLMTLLLCMEELEAGRLSLEDKVTVSQNAAGQIGSQALLDAGAAYPLKDLLHATIIASANDAAVALAEHMAGTEADFAVLMNQRAQELGMTNTCYVNATGLPVDGQHTTARDVALMSRALISHELIKEYTTIWMDSIRGGEFELANTNKLVYWYPGCTGLKTGYTSSSRYCLSATAERNGDEYIAVIMHSESPEKRNAEAEALLDFAFAACRLVPLNDGAQLPRLPVELGEKSHVALEYGGEPKALMPKGAEPEYEAEFEQLVKAPVKKGDRLGTLKVTVNGEQVADTPIIAAEDVERIGFFGIFGRLAGSLVGL